MIVGMIFEEQKEQLLADPHYLALEQKLLSLGGREMVYMPVMPELLDYIRVRGQSFDAATLRQVKGQPSNCHENVAKRYKQRKGKERMVHGYGLSDDGLWRLHSWLIDGSDGVIETTVSRIAYYGIVLEGPLVEWFLG